MIKVLKTKIRSQTSIEDVLIRIIICSQKYIKYPPFKCTLFQASYSQQLFNKQLLWLNGTSAKETQISSF